MTTKTLDPAELLGPEAMQDPYPAYDRLRAAGPVQRIGDSGFWAVSSWAAVTDAVGRPADFSANLTAAITYAPEAGVAPFPMDAVGGPTHVLATADDPAHLRQRRILLPHLAAKRIRQAEPLVADTFDRLWAPDDAGIEWMAALANRLPMIVVSRIIGAPDEDLDRLIGWAYQSLQLLDGLRPEQELAAAGAATLELSGYLAELLNHALAGPADDLVGSLAAALADGTVDRLTAQIMLITLFGAGGESTASLLGTAVWLFATRPDLQCAVRENPELLRAFVEETLRFEPPFRAHYRHVLRDTELAGVELPAGARLLLLWGAANRDPERFEDPATFRLDRPDSKAHITFGRGTHFCVGAALARMEAMTVLRKLLAKTAWIEATDVGPWLPSILVRRRAHLHLAVRPTVAGVAY